MFNRLTYDHVLLAFSQADSEGRRPVQINYLFQDGKRYAVNQIVRLAYKLAYNTVAPDFTADQAVQVLTGLDIKTYRTDGPSPEFADAKQTTFTWVPFYREMCPKLPDHSPTDLIELIKQVIEESNQVGINDRDAEGNVFPLADVDPYTFLSFLNKMGNTKRLAVLARLREKLSIASPTPTDLDGLPSSQAQNVWFFGYAYKRQADDIDHLRALYKQVEDDSVTNEQFQRVLAIYRVGKAKLTEALFYQKPARYLPMNDRTKLWLKKRSLPYQFETFADYQHLLEVIRQHDPRPPYEISREAFQENSQEQTRYFCIGVDFGADYGGNQLPRFIEEGVWENGYGPEKEKFAKLVKNIPVGAKLAAKSSFTSGTQDERTSQLKIKCIGTVVSNPEDGKTLIVDWEQDFAPFTLQGKGYYRSTVQEVTRPEDIQAIFFLKSDQLPEIMPEPSSQYPKNIILYGPPGTGKTYETVDLSVDIIDGHKSTDHPVNKTRFDALRREGQIEFVTFHQNYTYEDFVMGLKPDTDGDDLKFQRSYGIFYRMAKRARDNYEASRAPVGTVTTRPFQEVFDTLMKPLVEEGQEIKVTMASGVAFSLYDLSERSISFRKSNGSVVHTLSIATLRAIYDGLQEIRPNGLKPYYRPLSDELARLGRQTTQPIVYRNYVLIIDEINRANMSRVFGELITLLEDDKRLGADMELTVTLPSGEPFTVPPNLYLIGTMNTADKSLSLLDIALRRRFEFIGKYPNYEVLDNPAKDLLERLNKAILAYPKPADLLIGHAYFIGKDSAQLPAVFDNRVIPLLMEYFNGRVDQVETLLERAGIKSKRHPLTNQLTVIHVA